MTPSLMIEISILGIHKLQKIKNNDYNLLEKSDLFLNNAEAKGITVSRLPFNEKDTK